MRWRLVIEADGGYRIEGPAGEWIEARPGQARGREVSLPGGARGKLRDASEWQGFVLEQEPQAVDGRTGREDRERERPMPAASGTVPEARPPLTTRPAGPPGVWMGAALLLEDGRLFWLVRDGSGGFELADWEVPGGYWVARCEGEAWWLEPTVAGEALEAPAALLVLLAAEIVEATAGER